MEKKENKDAYVNTVVRWSNGQERDRCDIFPHHSFLERLICPVADYTIFYISVHNPVA
tara:strand:- start:973 stop:1146 length:174 start_codon:yes stop_codon:yes gene_type:complete